MPRSIRENTLEGFELAIARGADGIELDVHRTLDGVVVVHHDPTLPDGRAIAAITRANLTDPGIPYSIPTLAEVCSLVHGRIELFVEIKGDGIEDEVLATLHAYRGPFAIHSFDHAAITRIARSNATCRLGVLLEATPSDARAIMDATGALDLWPHHSIATPEMIDDVHVLGGRVLVWTVNDVERAKHLTAIGVDAICTDDVSMSW